MRVAILSAGPSLRQTFNPDERFDLRIGVNSAAAVYHCDWWSCGDGQTFARVAPIGLPALFTMTREDGHLRQTRVAQRLERFRVETWPEMKRYTNAPACWTNWSITAALVLAVDQGATSVEVFGHDMSGRLDVSGHDLLKRESNWKRVRADWNTVREWAVSRGIWIVEHQPEHAPCRT